MKYFVIFGLLLTMIVSIGFVQPTSAQMICAAGDEQFHFTINDVVFIGTVTAISPSDSHRLWNYISFDIQYPFKGLTNQTQIIIPTYQGSTYGFEPELGSKYLIHASKTSGVDLFTSLCSNNKLLDTEQDVEEMKNKLLEIYTLPPLKQKQHGIASHAIKCKQNLVLIQKYDGTPACVTPETKEKLIERGWANINTDKIRQTVSLPSPPDPMSIAITGNDKLPIFTIKRGETKEIGILLGPKIPITFATVSVDSYFGSAGDCNNISTDSYCPGRGIIMKLSETEITAKKEITLTITIPENMTVGTYGYQIETKTTFDMPSVEKPRTVGNSVRFDLAVI